MERRRKSGVFMQITERKPRTTNTPTHSAQERKSLPSTSSSTFRSHLKYLNEKMFSELSEDQQQEFPKHTRSVTSSGPDQFDSPSKLSPAKLTLQSLIESVEKRKQVSQKSSPKRRARKGSLIGRMNTQKVNLPQRAEGFYLKLRKFYGSQEPASTPKSILKKSTF